GLGPLLRAIAMGSPSACLLIAGNGRQTPYVRMAKQLGVGERVAFLGSRFPVSELFAVSTLLCHPTWYDPCSRVVLEALQFGIPVVTTKWNGAAECIRDGIDGAVISDPDSISELTAAIRAASRMDPGRLSRSDDLTMARHARELIALYSRGSKRTV
ncbi:MAG: glycosyltransferase, partial [Phycisphaerae bacterium]